MEKSNANIFRALAEFKSLDLASVWQSRPAYDGAFLFRPFFDNLGVSVEVLSSSLATDLLAIEFEWIFENAFALFGVETDEYLAFFIQYPTTEIKVVLASASAKPSYILLDNMSANGTAFFSPTYVANALAGACAVSVELEPLSRNLRRYKQSEIARFMPIQIQDNTPQQIPNAAPRH